MGGRWISPMLWSSRCTAGHSFYLYEPLLTMCTAHSASHSFRCQMLVQFRGHQLIHQRLPHSGVSCWDTVLSGGISLRPNSRVITAISSTTHTISLHVQGSSMLTTFLNFSGSKHRKWSRTIHSSASKVESQSAWRHHFPVNSSI